MNQMFANLLKAKTPSAQGDDRRRKRRRSIKLSLPALDGNNHADENTLFFTAGLLQVPTCRDVEQ